MRTVQQIATNKIFLLNKFNAFPNLNCRTNLRSSSYVFSLRSKVQFVVCFPFSTLRFRLSRRSVVICNKKQSKMSFSYGISTTISPSLVYHPRSSRWRQFSVREHQNNRRERRNAKSATTTKTIPNGCRRRK